MSKNTGKQIETLYIGYMIDIVSVRWSCISIEMSSIIQFFMQVLYAGEGESRKPDENATPPVMSESEKVQSIIMKVSFFLDSPMHSSKSKPLDLVLVLHSFFFSYKTKKVKG